MPEHDPLRIFIGYDSREAVAYHVLAHSILRRATVPVAVIPLVLGQLGAVYTRPRGPTESTEFSLTRFLVPYLSGFQGHSVFMDSDMLCLADVAELREAIFRAVPDMTDYQRERTGPPHAVMVCQHDYTPKTGTKFLGQQQTAYPRKNWSSLMVFNNNRCRALTPAYVNAATGLELHRFQWTESSQIAALPLEWNWLVGEYPQNPAAKILHYTLGGPWFRESQECDHFPEWNAEYLHMVGPLFTEKGPA